MSIWHRRQGSSDNLLEFLTRQTHKDLIVDFIKGVKAIKSQVAKKKDGHV